MLSIFLRNGNKKEGFSETPPPPRTPPSSEAYKYLSLHHNTTFLNPETEKYFFKGNKERAPGWMVYAKVAGIVVSVVLIMTFIVCVVLVIRKYKLKQCRKRSCPKFTNPNYQQSTNNNNSNLNFQYLTQRVLPSDDGLSLTKNRKACPIPTSENNNNNNNKNKNKNNINNNDNNNNTINRLSMFSFDSNWSFPSRDNSLEFEAENSSIFYDKEKDILNFRPQNTKNTNNKSNNKSNNITNGYPDNSNNKSIPNIEKTQNDNSNMDSTNNDNSHNDIDNSNNNIKHYINKNNKNEIDTPNNNNINKKTTTPDKLLSQTQEKLHSLQQQHQQQQLRLSQRMKILQLRQQQQRLQQRPHELFPVICYTENNVNAFMKCNDNDTEVDNHYILEDEDDKKHDKGDHVDRKNDNDNSNDNDNDNDNDNEEDDFRKQLLKAPLDSYDKTLNPFYNSSL